MNSLHRFSRVFAAAALATLGSTGAFAQSTWDLDACTNGTKAANGYTSCAITSGTPNTATVDIKAYSSTGAATNFTTASTSINNGGSYLGVWSGNENTGGTSGDSPHHAIDNVNSYGSSYELVHLQFSKAVDLSQLVANWVVGGASTGEFQLWRWNYNAGTPNPTITGFNPNTMTGWTSVSTTSGDFGTNLTQSVTDGSYNSSHWLIATKFGGTNDAFKLGTISATNICAGSNNVNGGGCASGLSVPEPATLAMVLLAGGLAASSSARRRRI